MDAQQVADRSGVPENDPNPESTALVTVSAQLEADEVNESREQIQKNGLSESIGVSIPALLNSGNPPQPANTDLPSLSDVRRVLHSVITRNAQARAGNGGESSLAEPQGEIQGLLTDGICRNFAEQMGVIEEQKGLLSNSVNGLPSMNDIKLPKAPRAMSITQRVRILEDLLLQDQSTPNGINNLQNPLSNPQNSIPLFAVPPPTTASLHGKTIPSTLSSTIPPSEGMHIPLDSKFLKPVRSADHEEGEIMSNRTSSVTPPNDRKAPPLKKYGSVGRSLQSPEPIRRRLPTVTHMPPDKRPPSPRRRTSRPSLSPEPPRHSRSPSYTRRPLSPDYRTNRGWKQRRRSSHPYEPRSPISPRFPTQRRASEHDAPPGKPSDRPWRDRDNDPENKHQSPVPDWQKLTRNASDIRTLSDHHAPNHEQRLGSVQGLQSNTESSSVRHVSTHSMSPTNNDRADDVFHSPPGSGQDSTASGVAERMPSSSILKSIADAELVKPCHNVPGLWMVKVGTCGVEIVTCEFEIDKVAADRWGIRGASRHGKEKAHDALSLSLRCVPLSEVSVVRETLDMSAASAQDVANAIDQIEAVWPPAGHLVVQINPDREWGRSWLPRHLGEDHSSIDMTEHVHEGTNVVRLIQLAGLANYMFVVLAKEKPPDILAVDAESTIAEPGEEETEQLLNSFKMTTQIIYS